MNLDLTKAHRVEPVVICVEDGATIPYRECIRCRCHIPIVAGDTMCLSGITDFKKEILSWGERHPPEIEQQAH